MQLSLPIIESLCDGCGACCREQFCPPGYVGMETLMFASREDEQRFYSMPQEAKDAIWAYLDRIDEIPDGEPLPECEPCCWLDLETMRCRWYEYRPSICREFEVDGNHCREWREQYRIDRTCILGMVCDEKG